MNEPRRATSNMEEIPEFIAKNMENPPYQEPSTISTNTYNIKQKVGFKGGFLRGITAPKSRSGVSFVKYIFLIWFVLSIYWFLKNDTTVSFSNFLNNLGAWNEGINISGFFNSLSDYMYIGDEWPILDGLRVFLNMCGRLIGFVLGAIGGLLDIVSFITIFLMGASY